jgi:hypothetical protein
MTCQDVSMSDAEALRHMRELWVWAVNSKRPYFAYLVAVALIAFDFDNGPGKFVPPGLARGIPVGPKKPRRGRPPKKRD